MVGFYSPIPIYTCINILLLLKRINYVGKVCFITVEGEGRRDGGTRRNPKILRPLTDLDNKMVSETVKKNKQECAHSLRAPHILSRVQVGRTNILSMEMGARQCRSAVTDNRRLRRDFLSCRVSPVTGQSRVAG